jgi:zinc protease
MSALHNNVSCMEVDDEVFLHLPRIMRQEGKLYEHSSRRPEFVAAKWFYEQLYPNHPYSQVPFLNPATLQDMRPTDAQSFLSSHYRPDNGVAVVYGGITVDEVKAAAEKYLSKWKGGGGASMTPVPATEGPTKREIHLVNRPGATQAQVQVGCRLEPVKPDKLPAYDVLQAVARESAWVMREQWGATYGIGAGVAKQADNSAHFQMSGAVVNAQAGKAVARLLQLIELLANAKVSEPLFLTKRWDVGREYMTNLALADSQAQAIAEARQHGWPLEVWDRYPENLANTTQQSLKEIMAPCLTAPVMAIVGDAAVLKPQLEQEGLKLSSQ